MQSYYYVYRVGYPRPLIVKHATLTSAHAESIRLSAQHPGAQFEILQCLGFTHTVNPSTFWLDGVDPSAETPAQ